MRATSAQPDRAPHSPGRLPAGRTPIQSVPDDPGAAASPVDSIRQQSHHPSSHFELRRAKAAWADHMCSNLTTPTMISRRWRWGPVLAVVALAAFATFSVRSLREPVLRAAGWALVVNESIDSADLIVLSLDSGGAGALEAADLLKSGISKRVAVFIDPPSGPDHEFIRRGLPYEDLGAAQTRQLRSLGVTEIVRISRVDGTDAEGRALPQWCDDLQLKSIVFVASRDHSRRVRRVLDRAMKGHPTRVSVRAAQYSIFDPDQWWETRSGIRIEIFEFQKLLMDIVLHPISF